jgi:hypothetical protein
MLSQEKFYQLVLNEEWTQVLDILYSNKNDIANDSLLKQAANVFEQEFFRKVSDYSNDRTDVHENLETMYILHHGKFYRLSDKNYRQLVKEIVKRKPVKDAFNYAKEFPDDEICKPVIEKYNADKLREEGFKLRQPTKVTMNWIEIYNRLFELINNQNDTATYYSGPKFINTVREFEPYFPDYSQFISKRNLEGKSTSRKIFYYDILLSLSDETRIKVVKRILEIVRPFEAGKATAIESLLGIMPANFEAPKVEPPKQLDTPVVFISYSWDNEEHKKWVLNLANRLCTDGVDAILDQYYLKPGKNLPHFVENSISKAHRILIIFTPNYKLKADKRAGGVGYEYSIMNADLYKNQTANDKVIPVLRTGKADDSIPTFMQQFIHIDLTNDENFENSYTDLLREIYNEPAIVKPAIGAKPTFKENAENVEKPSIGEKPEIGLI